jgi:hypothetical protein
VHKWKRLCRPFTGRYRFSEKDKEHLLREAYKFLSFKITPQSEALASMITQVLCGDLKTYKIRQKRDVRETSSPGSANISFASSI